MGGSSSTEANPAKPPKPKSRFSKVSPPTKESSKPVAKPELSSRRCPKHIEIYEYYCEECRKKLCRSCKNSHSHPTILIVTYLKITNNNASKYSNWIRQVLVKMKKRPSDYQLQIDEIKERRDELVQELEKKFQEVLQFVEKEKHHCQKAYKSRIAEFESLASFFDNFESYTAENEDYILERIGEYKNLRKETHTTHTFKAGALQAEDLGKLFGKFEQGTEDHP